MPPDVPLTKVCGDLDLTKSAYLQIRDPSQGLVSVSTSVKSTEKWALSCLLKGSKSNTTRQNSQQGRYQLPPQGRYVCGGRISRVSRNELEPNPKNKLFSLGARSLPNVFKVDVHNIVYWVNRPPASRKPGRL